MLPDCYVQFITSFLQNRNFRARIDGFPSQERSITADVDQGSVLGLFPCSVNVSEESKQPGVELSVLAGGTAVYSVEENADYVVARLQRQLDAYIDLADKWKVVINAPNNTAVVFSRRIKLTRSLVIGMSTWANNGSVSASLGSSPRLMGPRPLCTPKDQETFSGSLFYSHKSSNNPPPMKTYRPHV